MLVCLYAVSARPCYNGCRTPLLGPHLYSDQLASSLNNSGGVEFLPYPLKTDVAKRGEAPAVDDTATAFLGDCRRSVWDRQPLIFQAGTREGIKKTSTIVQSGAQANSSKVGGAMRGMKCARQG